MASGGGFDADQTVVLAQIAGGAELSHVLDAIVHLIERQAEGMLCSVLLFDAEHKALRNGAAPSLPVAYWRAIDGALIGPTAGSCGAAAFHREPIIVENIETHPNWTDYRELALPHDLRACWSTPIMSSDRELLGTFAMYFHEPRGPSTRERVWVAAATHLAAIAIMADRSKRALGTSVAHTDLLHSALDERTAQLERLQRLYDALAKVNRAAVRAKSIDELFIEVSRVLVAVGGFGSAWIGRLDPNARILSSVARAGDGHDIAIQIPIDEIEGRGPSGSAVREGRPHVCNDVRDPNAVAWHDVARRWGWGSAASFPVRDDSGVHHSVTVYARTANFFGRAELELLEEVAGELGFALDMFERERVRRQTDATLRANDAMLRLAGRAAHLGWFSIDLATKVVTWSDEVCTLIGVPPGVPRTLVESDAAFVAEFRDIVRDKLTACGTDGTAFDLEVQVLATGNRPVWVRMIGQAGIGKSGRIRFVHGALQDISDRRRLEDQLRQAQKMEAVGQLAGGVAHDFNNLLSVVLTYCGFVKESLPPTDPLRPDIDEIDKAATRAVELTRQLLAFSRKQLLRPRVIDLNQVATGLERMLRRVLGDHIDLAIVPDRDAGVVRADPGQIEQVIVNLAVNARDAMPDGGRLLIEVENVYLDAAYAEDHHNVIPGSYSVLAVTDSGVGMDAATQARLFEPFFTTKERGKGTGLGLSTAYGIVAQSGGHISVESELNRGATFKVYLPQVQGVADPLEGEAARPTSLRGSETILVVEDDDQVRGSTREVLVRSGYNVITTSSGSEALVICEQYHARIHLLVTDVVMPGMSGRELAELVAPIRSDMPVLYVSGYTEDAIVRHGVVDAGIAFLAKPLTAETLLHKVREMLERTAR